MVCTFIQTFDLQVRTKYCVVNVTFFCDQHGGLSVLSYILKNGKIFCGVVYHLFCNNFWERVLD